MKIKSFAFFLLLLVQISSAQESLVLNFDNSVWNTVLKIDSASNPNNIWEIGAPTKTVLNAAYSSPNVIITKKNGSYPINDTSAFIIKRIAGSGFFHHATVFLQAQYFVNSDTLTDYGKIEFSYNKGNSWIDLSNSALCSQCNPFPKLTGNSNGWQYFNIDILGYDTIKHNVTAGDTLLYRFSFISDNLQTNKDGLMFDDFHFDDYIEGVKEFEKNNLISIYPNPTSEQIIIAGPTDQKNASVKIFNALGITIYDIKSYTGNPINLKNYPDGIYFLKYSFNNNFVVKKIVIKH